jgi:hypothetical protein
MEQNITELATALVAAQAEMPVAKFDATNPHFRNKYATLQCMVETARPVLAKHGLAIIQGVVGNQLITRILHTSGGWFITSEMDLRVDKDNMQGLGSAITYARRYSFAAAIGMVSDEDDDGEMASKPSKPAYKGLSKAEPAQTPSKPSKAPEVPRSPTGDWRDHEIHFGKNAGTALGSLSERSLTWYQTEWQPKPYNGEISEQDQALRDALDESMGKDPATEPEPEPENPPVEDIDDDNIPF